MGEEVRGATDGPAADPASNSEKGQMEQSLQAILGKWVSNLRSCDTRKTCDTATIKSPPNTVAEEESEEDTTSTPQILAPRCV